MSIKNLLICTILVLLSSSFVNAKTIKWNGVNIQALDWVSLKNFSAENFTDKIIPPGTTVYSSSFYREEPDSIVFRADMTKVTFIECNLDNVVIPAGNLVRNTYRDQPKKIKAQNDLEDWVLNNDNTPKEPVEKQKFIDCGISTDPKDIPNPKQGKGAIQKKKEEGACQ